jgi:hypothetical protein
MVAPVEVTVDAKGMPLPPIDPNVAVPARVKAEADRAAQLHAQAYQTPLVTAPVTQAPPPPPTQAPPPPPTQVNPVAPVQVSPAPDDRSTWDAAKWMQHAKSMEGRFRQSQETLTTLQTNMSEMTEALANLQQRPQVQQRQEPPPPPLTPLITKEDIDTYGNDFLSVAQRAALEAVRPTLQKLEQRNQNLERQLQNQASRTIELALSNEVPNWEAINVSPKFKSWLRLRDIYSNRVRQDLLTEAHRAADAARVVRFFKGFLAEEEATGSTEFLANQEPPRQAVPPTPSVELTSLAAPGHAKPAVGNLQPDQPANAPIWITRGQITQFYKNVRSGVYAGREQDRMNDEAIIFECQRAGRVR